MEQGDLILGKVNLNAYTKKEGPSPVIEMLDWDGASDGDIVVLKVLRKGRIK